MQLLSAPKILEKYARDKSIYYVKPHYVAFPKSEKEIIEILRFAQTKHLSITPRGGGTGLSGSAIGDGIVLDLSKHYTKIHTIGKKTRVQAGLLLAHFRPALKKKGYMLPSVPLHGKCAIGGNVSTRSVGSRTLKYGLMDAQVTGIRGILADGGVLDTIRGKIPTGIREKLKKVKEKLQKDKEVVAYVMRRPPSAGGYNLRGFLMEKNFMKSIAKLVCGSTGTLLVLTEVGLALPKEKPLKDLYLVHFGDYDSLQCAMNKVIKDFRPASIEYVGKMALEEWEKQYHFPYSIGAVIFGFEHVQSLRAIEKMALEIRYIPEKQRAHLWKSRELVLPKLWTKAARMHKDIPSGIDDACIPPRAFARVMGEVDAYAAKKNIPLASFGHIGIGSLHLRAFLDMKKHPAQLEKMGMDVFRILRKYGGTLVGEHDAGRCRSKYLKLENQRMYAYLHQIKKIFDPKDTLNPHIVFDLRPITQYIKV